MGQRHNTHIMVYFLLPGFREHILKFRDAEKFR